MPLDSERASGSNGRRPLFLAYLTQPGGAPFGGGTLPLRLMFRGGGLEGGGGARLEGLSIEVLLNVYCLPTALSSPITRRSVHTRKIAFRQGALRPGALHLPSGTHVEEIKKRRDRGGRRRDGGGDVEGGGYRKWHRLNNCLKPPITTLRAPDPLDQD